MKKQIRLLLLLAAAVALLTVPAFADETVTPAGIYNVSVETAFNSKVTVAPQDASGTSVADAATQPTVNGKATTNFYAGAEKLQMTYLDAINGAYYLVLVQDAEGAPTEANIQYIDQSTSTVSFVIYPKQLTSGKTYYIYLSTSNGSDKKISGKTLVASFNYYAPYTLGDVDDSGIVDTSDALQILQHIVKNVTLQGNNFSAADVADPKGTIDTSDALKILQYIVKNITTFD